MSTKLDSSSVNSLKNTNSGGYTALTKITGAQLAVDGAAYATGDVLGTTSPIAVEVVRAKNGTAILHSLILQDLSKQSAATDMVIFDANPTATTFTDNSALDIADADLSKVIGVVSVASGDYASFNDNSVSTTKGISLPIQNNSTNTSQSNQQNNTTQTQT